MDRVRQLIFVIFSALALRGHAQVTELYRCVGPEGQPRYTFDKRDTVGKECKLVQREVQAPRHKSPSHSQAPRGKSRGDSASPADIDKLTTYAVVLGRAVACGVNIEDASRRVGLWMDRRFPPGSTDQKTYLPIFIDGVSYHAQQQKSGKSPDPCSAVLRSFNGFPWP